MMIRNLWEYLRPKNFNLYFLDINPDKWQAFREIRKDLECPIILTARGEIFYKALGLKLGAAGYIVKPFETKEVVAGIKVILRRT